MPIAGSDPFPGNTRSPGAYCRAAEGSAGCAAGARYHYLNINYHGNVTYVCGFIFGLFRGADSLPGPTGAGAHAAGAGGIAGAIAGQ